MRHGQRLIGSAMGTRPRGSRAEDWLELVLCGLRVIATDACRSRCDQRVRPRPSPRPRPHARAAQAASDQKTEARFGIGAHDTRRRKASMSHTDVQGAWVDIEKSSISGYAQGRNQGAASNVCERLIRTRAAIPPMKIHMLLRTCRGNRVLHAAEDMSRKSGGGGIVVKLRTSDACSNLRSI